MARRTWGVCRRVSWMSGQCLGAPGTVWALGGASGAGTPLPSAGARSYPVGSDYATGSSPSLGQANDASDVTAAASPSPEERYLLCEQRAHLESLLAELEPEQRAVLVSHELDATPMRDVARAQRIPVNTAWNRLRLAREDIRNRWHRHRRRKPG
jgi:hypothetical protein